jgi:hypothetical protein
LSRDNQIPKKLIKILKTHEKHSIEDFGGFK